MIDLFGFFLFPRLGLETINGQRRTNHTENCLFRLGEMTNENN